MARLSARRFAFLPAMLRGSISPKSSISTSAQIAASHIHSMPPVRTTPAVQATAVAEMFAKLLPSSMAFMVESKRSSIFSAVAAERLPSSAADSILSRLHSV